MYQAACQGASSRLLCGWFCLQGQQPDDAGLSSWLLASESLASLCIPTEAVLIKKLLKVLLGPPYRQNLSRGLSPEGEAPTASVAGA